MPNDIGEQSSLRRGGYWEGSPPIADKGAVRPQILKDSAPTLQVKFEWPPRASGGHWEGVFAPEDEDELFSRTRGGHWKGPPRLQRRFSVLILAQAQWGQTKWKLTAFVFLRETPYSKRFRQLMELGIYVPGMKRRFGGSPFPVS